MRGVDRGETVAPACTDGSGCAAAAIEVSAPVAPAGRAGLQGWLYSLIGHNLHFQRLGKELERLQRFLRQHGVVARSAVDVGCGDGAVTARLRRLLGLKDILGIELNPTLAAKAAARGIDVLEADMETITLDAMCELVISYGSLHHAELTEPFVRRLAALSERYVLIVDNTVRKTLFHRITGSRRFPLEMSPYAIRSVEQILAACRSAGLSVRGVATFRNVNVWTDRSFVLAEKSRVHDPLPAARSFCRYPLPVKSSPPACPAGRKDGERAIRASGTRPPR